MKSPLAIAAVGELSGPVASAVVGGVRAVQAWVASVNAKGGINCHPLKYFLKDDGGDPSRHQALVRQAVEQQHVLAFVQMSAPIAGRAGVKYLTEKRIPVVGAPGDGDWFYESPMYFPQMSQGTALARVVTAGAADLGRAQGMTKLAVITCVEAGVCSSVYDEAPATAAKRGATVVYRAQVSLAQPDFTSNCQAAQSAGAQVLFLGADQNFNTRIVRSCNGVNYRPLFVAPAQGVDSSLASNPQFEGSGVVSPTLPWVVTSNPGIAEYLDTLDKYAPGKPPDSSGISGWTSAKLFELATRSLSEPPTSESILEGLWSVKDNDLGGLTYPLTYTKEQASPLVVCWWVMQITGSRFISPDGGQRSCL